jgi:hypothetical protein
MTFRPRSPRALGLALALAAVVLAAARCVPTATITILRPSTDFLTDDATLDVRVQISSGFDAGSVEVRLDGVDLIAGLGLAPPFTDAAAGQVGEALGASGSLAAAALGDPFAAPPVGGGATSEFRAGFAAAAGARTQGP